MPACSTASSIRFASAAVRPSGLVHSTAFPARATRSTASSCRQFGTPTTTTSVSGWLIAAVISVVDSGIRQHGVDPLRHIVGGLQMVVLDVDDPCGDVASGGGDLAEDLHLGHLAVGEFEDELVNLETEHSVEHGPVGSAGQRSPEVVAEAEVGAQPSAAHDRLDRRI